MTDERRRAEWAPEETPAQDVDPRVMTLEDLLGTYAGDLLTWAQEREEPWTREAVALELVARRLATTEDELVEFRQAVARDLRAADAWRPEWERAGAGVDPELADAIAYSRLDSLMQALLELDASDLERARDEFDEDSRSRP